MKIPKRAFGSKPDQVSAIALGGVVGMGMSCEEASSVVGRSLDAGVNYFDIAPSYGDAEVVLGPVLAPHRASIFLACKTTERSREGSQRELESSLRQLQTDHFDLYQLHALSSLEDVDRVFGPDGAMETFLAAREKGQVRYIGFSAHSEEAALAALERFRFDSVLFPLNYFTYTRAGFGVKLFAKAKSLGAAVLSIKSMARRGWPEGAARWSRNTWYEPIQDRALSETALRWALFTLGVDVAVPPGDPSLYEWALEFAQRLKAPSPEELGRLADFEPEERPLFPL